MTNQIASRILLLSAASMSVLAASSHTQAQEVASSEVQVTDTIIVTGSRLVQRDEVSTAPVASVSQLDIALSGKANIEDMINTMPQFVGGQTSRSNNPGTGAAQINLRGLGFNRNLVLVNGRRYMYFSQDQVTDINTIPTGLVERVEVVTGGASAVYGSDAIAGVTNFILKDDFEGFEVDFRFGGDTAGDAITKEGAVTMGGNFGNDRGNAVLTFGYYDRGSILQGDREYSQNALGDSYDANGNPVLIPRGSTKTPNGGFANIPYGSALDQPAYAGLRAALAAAGLLDIGRRGFTFDGAGSSARAFIDPTDRYNFAPLNYLQTPMQRSNIFGQASYDITDNIEAYSEVSFSHNDMDMQLAEANISFIFPIDVDNPYVSSAMQEVFRQVDLLESGTAAGDGLANIRISRRFSEVGPRQALSTRSAWRFGGGFRGQLGDLTPDMFKNLSFDSYYFYARTDSTIHLNNTVSFSTLADGLLRASPGADPLVNPFGAGQISQTAADALRVDTASLSVSELQVASASITGEVFELPAGVVDASLGVETRSSYARSIPDNALSTGDVVGFSGFQPTEGSVGVTEVFAEARVPLLADQPMADSLSINGGFRYSDYDLVNVGGVWTYLGGVSWQPVADLKFRGQFQRAIRAPNIGELFGGQSAGRPRATDPCALPSAASNAQIRDLCIATGVPSAQVGDPGLQPESRIDAIFGGNPDLTAENADTKTIGFAYRPSQIEGLRISADYYDIEVTNAISVLAGGVDNILNLCYNVLQDINSAACQAVSRNPADGIIAAPFSVQAGQANIGALAVSGVDASVHYQFEAPFGWQQQDSRFYIDITGSWTEKYNITPVQELVDETSQCVGAFGNSCGEPRPEFKTHSRISWNNGPLTLGLTHRYLGEVTDDQIVVPARLGQAGPTLADFAEPVLEAQHYLDFSFVYDFDRVNVSVRGGVNNFTDNTPPITGRSQQQANTYPSTYDAVGPEYFFGIIKKF